MSKPKPRDGPKRLADEPEEVDDELDPRTGLKKPSPEQTDDANCTGSLGDPIDVDF